MHDETPADCDIHPYTKWCEHNGGVKSPTGYVGPLRWARAKLTEHAINQLWDQQGLDGSGVPAGCCPIHCGACYALKLLLDAGELENWLLGVLDTKDLSWWVDGRVDREWLARSWNADFAKDCHGDQ